MDGRDELARGHYVYRYSNLCNGGLRQREKAMKLALIPPFKMIDDMALSDYWLILPQLLRNPTYSAFVNRALMADKLPYVIMDNGAAEGRRLTSEELLNYAIDYDADELIIPDELSDGTRTLVLLHEFFMEHERDLIALGCGMPDGVKLGFVAQGSNVTEAMQTVNAVMEGSWAPYISVVYLPRLLVKSDDPSARIHLSHSIEHDYGERLEQHFLGGSTIYPREVEQAVQQLPWVRGIDTSLPYTLSAHGHPITMLRGVMLPRPESYFTRPYSPEFVEMSKANVATLRKWASGLSA